MPLLIWTGAVRIAHGDTFAYNLYAAAGSHQYFQRAPLLVFEEQDSTFPMSSVKSANALLAPDCWGAFESTFSSEIERGICHHELLLLYGHAI